VIFDFSALYAYIFFQLAFGRLKGVTQGHINVFVCLFVVMIATHHNLFLGNIEINPDLVEITLVLVMVFSLHSDPATDDVIAEVFKLRCFFTYPGFHCVRVRDTAKRNL